MDIVREYFWLWLLLAIIFVCVVMGLIFICINLCISKAGKHRLAPDHKSTAMGKKYQERNQTMTPPLPPRTQFLLAEAQSYENISERPSCGQKIGSHFQQITTDFHDHEPNMVVPCEPKQILDLQPNYKTFHDFEHNLSPIPKYEEITDEQANYVKVDDEDEPFPPAPPNQEVVNPVEDTMEDYDDVAGEDENQDEKDYDDVG
uniref:uncharacterized protein LOC131138046 isoform X1 n=1 Tax=Doryrhamphus excisus TaxID=161450 RepID=UPI0025AE9548|nr:uncharacterized protein LOC131138046 isoform X1 [Doryrhamphus excisus]